MLRGIHFTPSHLSFPSLLTHVPASIIKTISLSSATKTEFCHRWAHDPSLHPLTMFKKICFSSPCFAFQILEDFLETQAELPHYSTSCPFIIFFLCLDAITKLDCYHATYHTHHLCLFFHLWWGSFLTCRDLRHDFLQNTENNKQINSSK